MNKAKNLREHLLNSPLGLHGAGLLLSVADCKVTAQSDESNQHFELNYTADLLLLNFAGNADVLIFILLNWLDKDQPFRSSNAFSLTADVIDDKTADINIKIPLRETIKVRHDADGVSLVHQDEPEVQTLLDATEWKLFVKDELWAQWTQA